MLDKCMANFSETILKIILDEGFEKITISSPKQKSGEIKSIIVRKPFTVEIRYKKHNNIINYKNHEELKSFINNALLDFKQALIKTQNNEHQLLSNKKGDVKVISKKIQAKKQTNRKKGYLIPDDEKCDFLIQLGVMDKNGKVKSNQYKKFRQINRFLEMVNDQFKDAKLDKINVVDFGCGKSYLTFALYFYFSKILKIDANITGIDLKQDVIDDCNSIAKELHYDGLKFEVNFVKDYKSESPIDFVVTLHACDTATDVAINFAIQNKAKHMFFVPCCQHELNKQLQNNENSPLLKHGIFRDRMTALITDTARTLLIEASGYKVQCLEFIDSEHTAKNILLRCHKVDRPKVATEKIISDYKAFKSHWQITPYLEGMLSII